MRSYITRKFGALVATVALLAAGTALSPAAHAATVRGVSITKGKGWVRVTVDAPGAAFNVHETAMNASGYRSIVIDVPSSSIAGGLEPKSRVPINDGLVSQVRVKDNGGFVRVYIDVISFPKYTVNQGGGSCQIGLQVNNMRDYKATRPRR